MALAAAQQHGSSIMDGCAYPDEAVVEEEADEAGPVASVLADGGVDDGLDQLLGGRAGGVVVPHLQLRLRGVEACHHHGDSHYDELPYMDDDLISSGAGAHATTVLATL